MVAYFSTFIVGSVFLVTGIAKAFNSKQFIQHVFRFRLLPHRTVVPVSISFISLECALGAALVLHTFPLWFVLGAIILLLGLSTLTLWSTSSGRTEDCGCYGGLLIVSPMQSILLNLGYILLLGITWLYPIANHHTQIWQCIVTLLVLVTTGILSWQSCKKPLIDFARLKVGNRWKRRWLKDSSHDLLKGSYFIVFLSKDCPYCKRWVPFINVMNTQKDLPQALGIISLIEEELGEFKDEQMVRFPLISMDKLLLGYMVDAFPTAVLIEDGVITDKWIGQMPEEFVERIKQVYEKMIFKTNTQTSSLEISN